MYTAFWVCKHHEQRHPAFILIAGERADETLIQSAKTLQQLSHKVTKKRLVHQTAQARNMVGIGHSLGMSACVGNRGDAASSHGPPGLNVSFSR